MKEIWINLELYIKSYEFSIFRDFFRIFWLILRFLNDKNDLQKSKKGFIFRAGPTWMRRGMQGHMAALRRPTRRLRGVMSIIYIYLYIGLIYIVFRLSIEIINPLKPSHLINPTLFLNFFRVGLSSTPFLRVQGTW